MVEGLAPMKPRLPPPESLGIEMGAQMLITQSPMERRHPLLEDLREGVKPEAAVVRCDRAGVAVGVEHIRGTENSERRRGE